jgi:hypothetical protein
VVCPGTHRYVDQGSGTTPGLAAEAYAAVKAAKYADQDNLISFILETGGHVNEAAGDWLDTLTAPEPGNKCPARTIMLTGYYHGTPCTYTCIRVPLVHVYRFRFGTIGMMLPPGTMVPLGTHVVSAHVCPFPIRKL